jgi:hypothetical protein
LYYVNQKNVKGGAPHAAPAPSLRKSGDSSCLGDGATKRVLSDSALPFSSLAPRWGLPERDRARGKGGGSGAESQWEWHLLTFCAQLPPARVGSLAAAEDTARPRGEPHRRGGRRRILVGERWCAATPHVSARGGGGGDRAERKEEVEAVVAPVVWYPTRT